GMIINVASGAAVGTIPYGTAYCSSKAALVRFSDCLAAEVKQHNVAVFSVDPGSVLTDMSKYLLESDDGKKYVGWYANVFAEGRNFPPENSADLVTFLASGQANSLSGRFLTVDDNLPDMLQRAEEIVQNDLHMMRLRT